MPSHTIKVTGVSGELLRLLDERVKRLHSLGRSEYVRELIRRDVLDEQIHRETSHSPSFREILAPVHEETEELGITEEDILATAQAERTRIFKERINEIKR